ncbi:MAG: class I SAM-dependent methyltransferase [Pseudomonadota bacterium]
MDTVSFGDKDVAADEKEGLVRAVFDSVAPSYDLMNDLMSGGLHRVWKSVLLDRLAPQPGQTLLDVAGGTGDIALGFLARAQNRPARDRAPAKAIVCDINHAMMRAGQARKEAKEFGESFTQVCGNAESLPLPDKSVDRYTIGFGIRNVTNRHKALREAHRVLRPGGLFYCMEFSRPITQGFEKLYHTYSDHFIPNLGKAVTGDKDSYQYLVESIRRFPPQEVFAREVKDAGFARVKVENLTGGVVALHSGWKL